MCRVHARFRRDKAGPHGHVPGSVKAGNQVCRTGGKTRLHRSHPPDATGGRKVGTPGEGLSAMGGPTFFKHAASSTGRSWTSGRSWRSSRPPPFHQTPAWNWNVRPPCPSEPAQAQHRPSSGLQGSGVPSRPGESLVNTIRPRPFPPERPRKWWKAITSASAGCWTKPPLKTRP